MVSATSGSGGVVLALGDVQQAVDSGAAWRATARRWRQDTINMAHRVYSTRLLRRYTNTTCSLGMRAINKHPTIFTVPPRKSSGIAGRLSVSLSVCLFVCLTVSNFTKQLLI